MKPLNRLAYFAVSLIALVSAGAVLAGLVWLIVDIFPTLSKSSLTNEDKDNIIFTVTLAALVFGFCKMVEKPFDKIMDIRYPNDVPPNKHEVRKNWTK